jgi:eukaryotic-like serine/threonine-protein kinase
VDDPTSTPVPSGEVIAGRYELGAMIGRGGHGLVWRARDRRDGRDVAVKMLTDVAARDPGQVERLKREQQALVALAGTSAVGFLDLCQSQSGKLCLVMELLEGRDLERRLEELEQSGSKIELQELAEVLAPVVDTLERAHQSGILHRDLKPANVFLTPGGVRLLDFGLARMRSALPLTAAGTIVGSPSYIAPEVWKGRPDGLDRRVDVYSFGVMVFRALAGRLPFEGVTLQDKFRLATTAPRPSLRVFRPDLPADVDGWVEQVLAVDPDLRFNTLRGAWNAFGAAAGLGELGAELVSSADVAEASQARSPFGGPEASPPGSMREDSAARAAARGIGRGLGDVFRRAASAVTRLARGPKPWEQVEPSARVAPDPVAPLRPERSFVHEWLAGSDYRIQPEPKPAVTVSRVVAVGRREPPPPPTREPEPSAEVEAEAPAPKQHHRAPAKARANAEGAPKPRRTAKKPKTVKAKRNVAKASAKPNVAPKPNASTKAKPKASKPRKKKARGSN